MMVNPPGIVLSLLPAPQQAILSFDAKKAYATLYSTEEEKAAMATKLQVSEEDSDDEEEEESDEDEYDVDRDEDSEEDSDEETDEE